MFTRLAAALTIVAAFITPAMAADTIKVGAILAVTGPASFLGAPEAKTLEMLTADINTRGGINGKKLELIIKDSAASPEKAISFAKQLIEEEKVFAIIGPSTSGETMAMKNLAEESKTLLLSCAAAEVIVKPVAKYVFKTPQMDRDAVIRIFEQMKKMNISKVGVLSSNTGFGKAGKEQIEKLAPEHGIQVLVSEVYDKAATDLTAEVTKAQGGERPGRHQLVHRAGAGDRDQERPPDRHHRTDLPEPRLRKYSVRQGGGRCGGRRDIPGRPPARGRHALRQEPAEGGPDLV